MKKFILGRVLQTIHLLLACMCIFTSYSFASGASNILGDANGNGAINSTDYSLVKRYIAGIIKSFPNENGFTNADVTADGIVNSKDLSYIKRYILGMITIFPGDITLTDFIRPKVRLTVPTDPVPVNSDALFSINASDASGIKTQVLLLDGKEIILDSTANAVYKMESPGLYSVEAFVYDIAGNQGYARKDLLCVTDRDGKNPEALISSPDEGTVLTTSAAIKGTADDENFMAYTLEYSLKGKNNYIKFAEGKEPVKDGTLGVFDPALVKKGIYDIRLTVYDNGGLLSKANITVVADGNSQGRLIQSSTDLSYMASGVPLDFTRWYDSGNISSGDLGYGWSSYYGGIRISQSEDPSSNWEKGSEGSIHETKPHIVAVTYPDGKMDKFSMEFEESAVPSGETGHLKVSYKAFPGTTSSLGCENSDCYAYNNPDFGLWNGTDISSSRYIQGKFTLTTSDGKKIEFGLDGSVQNITEKNGIITTLTDEGMTAASQDTSVKVCYVKNAGVTENAYGLDGRSVTYAYDSYGDLVSVTGADGKKTSYRYDSGHRIIDIVGSDGSHTPVGYPVQTASTKINNIAMVADSIGMVLTQGYINEVYPEANIIDDCNMGSHVSIGLSIEADEYYAPTTGENALTSSNDLTNPNWYKAGISVDRETMDDGTVWNRLTKQDDSPDKIVAQNASFPDGANGVSLQFEIYVPESSSPAPCTSFSVYILRYGDGPEMGEKRIDLKGLIPGKKYKVIAFFDKSKLPDKFPSDNPSEWKNGDTIQIRLRPNYVDMKAGVIYVRNFNLSFKSPAGIENYTETDSEPSAGTAPVMSKLEMNGYSRSSVDAILLTFGRNEASWNGGLGIDANAYFEGYDKLIQLSRKWTNNVLMMNCPPKKDDLQDKWDENDPYIAFGNNFNDYFNKLIVKYNYGLNIFDKFKMLNVAPSSIMRDSYHPNEEGSRLVSGWIKDAIDNGNGINLNTAPEIAGTARHYFLGFSSGAWRLNTEMNENEYMEKYNSYLSTPLGLLTDVALVSSTPGDKVSYTGIKGKQLHINYRVKDGYGTFFVKVNAGTPGEKVYRFNSNYIGMDSARRGYYVCDLPEGDNTVDIVVESGEVHYMGITVI